MVWLLPRDHRPKMCVACSGSHGGPVVGVRRSCGVSVCAILPCGGLRWSAAVWVHSGPVVGLVVGLGPSPGGRVRVSSQWVRRAVSLGWVGGPAPATQSRRPRHANVRYSHHWKCVQLIKGPVCAECSSNTSRPATTARSVEEQVHRTTTPDRPTGDLQRGQDPSQHTDYSDRAIEYSANATSTCRRTPSPDSTEYSTGHTVYTIYSTKLLPPARCPDTMNDPQQQQQEVTVLTTKAVQSQGDVTCDDQRQTGSCITPGTPSDRPMTPSLTSAHSSIMDVDANNAKAPS